MFQYMEDASEIQPNKASLDNAVTFASDRQMKAPSAGRSQTNVVRLHLGLTAEKHPLRNAVIG